MKKLIIIGARGAGRESFVTATQSNGYGRDFEIKGFLDGKADALDGMNGYPPILSSVEDYYVESDDVFICALGDPKWRKYYSDLVKEKGGEFISIIDKTARIGKNVLIGKGCIIRNGADLSSDIKVGDFVYIQPYTVIGHDSVIGDYCHLNTYSFMGGGCYLGDMSIIHTGGIVLPHIRVNNNAIVGAGAVVIKNVKPNTTVFGNPAYPLDY